MTMVYSEEGVGEMTWPPEAGRNAVQDSREDESCLYIGEDDKKE